MKNPKDYATIKQGPGRGTHALTVELGDDLTLYFSYAEPVAVSYRDAKDGRFRLAVRECAGACATKTTAAHCAAIERVAPGRSTEATHAENLRARYNAEAFAELLSQLLPTAATFPGTLAGAQLAEENSPALTKARAALAVASPLAKKYGKARRALQALKRCPGLGHTDQVTGETFDRILSAALEV